MRSLVVFMAASLLIGVSADVANAQWYPGKRIQERRAEKAFGFETTTTTAGSACVGGACMAPQATSPQKAPVPTPGPVVPPPVPAMCMGTIQVCVNGVPTFLQPPTADSVLAYDTSTNTVYWSTIGALTKKVQAEVDKQKK